MPTAQISSDRGALHEILADWNFFIIFFQHLTTNPTATVRALVLAKGSSSLLLRATYFSHAASAQVAASHGGEMPPSHPSDAGGLGRHVVEDGKLIAPRYSSPPG